MSFVSRYVREQRRYTKNELRALFQFNEAEVTRFIQRLKSYGIMKAVKSTTRQAELSELTEEDLEITDENTDSADCFYVFTYVGVLTVGDRILKCYPKYIAADPEPEAALKQVLKVLQRYNNSKEQIINLYNGDGQTNSFNLLAVMLFLLEDYHQYGLYTNSEDMVELNGEGSILWEQTIDKGFAILKNNRPYYVDIYTQRSVDDEQDFILRLHKAVLEECSRQLENAGLLNLFDLVPTDVAAERLFDLGDEDYILYKIQSELNVQFNTHKQTILKTLYAFIAHQRTLSENYGISMFGTTHFEWVWETVCAQVFGNKLGTQLRNLPLPAPVTAPFHPTDRLSDIIGKPRWEGCREDGTTFHHSAGETLIPDLINLYQRDGAYTFVIFDAKYYCIQLEEDKALRNYPGVGDVAKQYLYQLAYKDFLASQGIENIRNCFLMPTEKPEVIPLGAASMGMLDNLGLQQIQIRQLPASEMFHCYLERVERPLEYLML